MLKQAHAQAAAHSTEDQASSHQAQEKLERMEFDLDVTEAPPTGDQLKNILEYLGGSGTASQVIRGAQNETDALKKLNENGDLFERPVVSTETMKWKAVLTVLGGRLEPGQSRYETLV